MPFPKRSWSRGWPFIDFFVINMLLFDNSIIALFFINFSIDHIDLPVIINSYCIINWTNFRWLVGNMDIVHLLLIHESSLQYLWGSFTTIIITVIIIGSGWNAQQYP